MAGFQLENRRFRAQIMAQGGELVSLWDKQLQREWIWQPQPGIWAHSATQLFPVVGRLVQGGVRAEGHFWPLEAHGFLRHQRFACLARQADRLVLAASADRSAPPCWPWRWQVTTHWVLHPDGLALRQQVINRDHRPMWFSLGWHPGFALPVASQPGWRIAFSRAVAGPFPTRDRTLSLPVETPFTHHFRLTPEVFRHGALYFGRCRQRRMAVLSPTGREVMALETGTQPWLALWGVPGADLLCLEPLAGTTDDPAFDGRLAHKRGIHCLRPGASRAFDVRLRMAVDA